MKKICALLIASFLIVSSLCLCVAADFEHATPFAEYTVLTADQISYDYRGETGATAMPRGGSTLDCLIDGEIIDKPTNHDDTGLVLVRNDFIKPDYEVDMAMAEQPLDAIPEFFFTLKYDQAVTFDAIYMSLFYQVFDCVTAPGENRVIVETSEDGTVWLPVGDDGMFYYRDTQPEYTDKADPYQEEIIVPLGEELTTQYVRLTFTFKIRPESDTYWAYYTNVYEWAGFSELSVARYTGGDKQEPMTQEYASAPALDLVDTIWYFEQEDQVALFSFYQKDGANYHAMTVYEADAFAENGTDAEPVHTMETTYTPSVDYIIVHGDTPTVIYITLDEDVLTYGDGAGNDWLFDAYVVEDGETSDETSDATSDETSDATSLDTEDDTSVETSKDASTDTSKPASTTSASTSSNDAQTDDESGFPIWVIVLIAVAAVAVVVVVIIVAKKK